MERQKDIKQEQEQEQEKNSSAGQISREERFP